MGRRSISVRVSRKTPFVGRSCLGLCVMDGDGTNGRSDDGRRWFHFWLDIAFGNVVAIENVIAIDHAAFFLRHGDGDGRSFLRVLQRVSG